jgi:predicted phosphoribosyltransferase
MPPLANRAEAGQLLAAKLQGYIGTPNVTVVALPRGGVPVAFEIAERLQAPLDVLIVRKVGFPGHAELAMGAVASGGVRILDRELIRSADLPLNLVDALVEREEQEIVKREKLLRDGHPVQDLSGRTVILVDDGAATGSTMLAAVKATRVHDPRDIIVALPVASEEAYSMLAAEVSRCVCLATPDPFFAVAQWYESFPQVTDDQVNTLLARSRAQFSTHEASRPGSQTR